MVEMKNTLLYLPKDVVRKAKEKGFNISQFTTEELKKELGLIPVKKEKGQVSVYLPKDLVSEAKESGLNISKIATKALDETMKRGEVTLSRLPKSITTVHTGYLKDIERQLTHINKKLEEVM